MSIIVCLLILSGAKEVSSQNNIVSVFGSFTTLLVNLHAFNFGRVKQSVQYANSRIDVARQIQK